MKERQDFLHDSVVGGQMTLHREGREFCPTCGSGVARSCVHATWLGRSGCLRAMQMGNLLKHVLSHAACLAHESSAASGNGLMGI